MSSMCVTVKAEGRVRACSLRSVLFRYGGVSIENWRARSTCSSFDRKSQARSSLWRRVQSSSPRLSLALSGELIVLLLLKNCIPFTQSRSSPTKTKVLTRKVELTESTLTNKHQVSSTHPPTPLFPLIHLLSCVFFPVPMKTLNNYHRGFTLAFMTIESRMCLAVASSYLSVWCEKRSAISSLTQCVWS